MEGPLKEPYNGASIRFRKHPQNKLKAIKADRRIKTIAGRLVRELERNLKSSTTDLTDIELFKRVLAQIQTSKNKIFPSMNKLRCTHIFKTPLIHELFFDESRGRRDKFVKFS